MVLSLHYRYIHFPAKRPVITLGGQNYRARPVIPVTIIGPSNSRLTAGLVDPGADDTIFHQTFAQHLGIDLSSAPLMTGSGVGMVPLSMRIAEVTFRLHDGREQREWRALVGFTSAKLRQPLLRYAGFLQYFTAKFDTVNEDVELDTNANYPGT